MFATYLPLLFLLIVALLIGSFFFFVGHFVARRPASPEQQVPFECGNDSTGARDLKLDVKFYLTAILFVVFDIEVVFIYPWAALFKELGWAGFSTMLAFITALGVALAYCWKKGALEWEN